MRIACVGGGPGGLYFALLMKRADPRHDVRVIERNRPDDTFGFGVVFSDATMAGIAEADAEAYEAIAPHLVHWNDIDVRRNGEVVTSTGHGFSGMSRHVLLRVLQEQAREAGVRVEFEREVTSLAAVRDADVVVASDGVNSTIRHLLEPAIQTTIDLRPNRFVWLGTTKPLPAFTFYFRETPHGLWRVHAYQYEPGRSTFIVECREETWRAAGMDTASEEETAAFLEGVFAAELGGHTLITNRSLWRQFPTIHTTPWSAGHVVLIGDAAHTAHFSVGSGTRMAMEDAIALRNALTRQDDLPGALAAFELERRPKVESLQRAAQASLEWFEHTERYMALDALQFTFSLLTRSLRITHEDLRARDAVLLRRVDEHVVRAAAVQTGEPMDDSPPPPPNRNRMRLPLAVFESCREIWPADKPMSARISAMDSPDGGITPRDAVRTAGALKALGCDIVQMSAGHMTPAGRAQRGRLFLVPFADQVRLEAGIATMVAGNLSSHMDVNTTIAAGRADLCVLSRAHVFDPYWTRHAAWMLDYRLPWPEAYEPVEGRTARFESIFTGNKG